MPRTADRGAIVICSEREFLKGWFRALRQSFVRTGHRLSPIKHLTYILATHYQEAGGKMQLGSKSPDYSGNGLFKTFR